MITRIKILLIKILVSIDQLFHILLAAPKYILIGGPVPNPDETISSKVGRQALVGKRWAKIAEKVINTLFYIISLGKDKNHCFDKIEWFGKPTGVSTSV